MSSSRTPRKSSRRCTTGRSPSGKSDSQSGAYEIVQITRPKRTNSKALDPAQTVLIESRMIAANPDGAVDFTLYVGDKAPKENMGRRGHVGVPIIFSGRGTGRGESNWIILPGSKVDNVIPSVKGTRMSDGKLNLIQFIVTKADGEKVQTDVVLRRK